MSRRLTAASRSGLVLFLADTGVTLRRKATTQNLPALRAFPCSLFSPWQHPVLLSFSRGAGVSPLHEAMVGGEGSFEVSLQTPVLFASGPSPMLGASQGGIALAELWPHHLSPLPHP